MSDDFAADGVYFHYSTNRYPNTDTNYDILEKIYIRSVVIYRTGAITLKTALGNLMSCVIGY